jgi:hypothetical protein
LVLGLCGVLLLLAYSVIFTEQPLFTEAPADKAIFAILTLLAGQAIQIIANYLSKTSSPLTPPPMQNNFGCQPRPMYSPMGTGMMPPSYGGIAPLGNLDNSTAGFSIDPTQAWTPPPPPTTPPVLEHEEERERMAMARAEAKNA